jgi:hypothetical protein
MRKSILALLLSCSSLVFAGDVAQIVNFVGGVSTSASPSPTVNLTLAAGDSIIAMACVYHSNTSLPSQATPTDTLGNTWSSELSVDNSIGVGAAANCHAWRVRNSVAGSDTTINLGGGSGTISWTWQIYQVRYLDTGAADVTASFSSASASGATMSYTTTNANDFVIGINFNQSGSTRSPVNYGNNYYGGCYDIQNEGSVHGWSCTDFTNKTVAGSYKANYFPGITASQIGIVVAFKVTSHACGGTGYTSVRTLTIDHTKVGSSDLSHFPSLWCANSSGVCNAAYTDFKITGSGGTVQSSFVWNSSQFTVANDFITCDAATGGHYVDFDWGAYTTTSGELAVFIAPATTSHTVDTPVFVFYGNANDKGHHATSNTWQNGFQGVWHQYVAGGGQLWDVSANAVGNSSMAGYSNTTGKYVGAVAWSGGFYEAAADSSYDIERTSPMTVCTWVNTSSGAANNAVIAHLNPSSPNNGWEFDIASGKPSLYIINNFGGNNYLNTTSTSTLNNGAWRRACVTYSGNSNTSGVTYYIDGTVDTTVSLNNTLSASSLWTGGNLDIARRSSCNCLNMSGSLQETWLATALRSADWMTADYNSQSSPSTYWSVSSAGTPTGSTPRRIIPSQVY